MNTSRNNNLTGNDQKQIDLIMQTSLQLLPLIMNNIPQAVFWKDRNLVYLGCNKAFADDAGFSSPEDVVGKTDFDMPWKAQAELYRADDSLVMEKGDSKINYEEPQTTPDGSTIWLSTSKIPVRENGQVVAVLGMYEDVTARKQVEKELLLRDRALASSLNAVVILNLQDSKPIYVNDAILKMTGYTREEVMQIGLADITANMEEPKKIREAIQSQGFFVGEELIKRKDGSVFFANFFSSLINDDRGQPIAVQSSFFDITERKQAEAALRTNEEKLRAIYESSNDAVMLLTEKGFFDCNPRTLEIFGFKTKEEFIATHPANVSPALQPDGQDSQLESHEHIQNAYQRGYERFEWTHRRANGTDFPAEVLLSAFSLGGQQVLQATVRDITERKQAEAQVNQNISFTRTLLDAVPTPVFYEDRDGRYQGCNHAFTEIMGMTSEEVRGKTVHELWPGENAKLYHQQDLEVMRNAQQRIYEDSVKDKNAVIRPVIFAKNVFFDEAGNVAGMVGAFLDISERKQAEMELVRLQSAVEQTGDGIALADLNGNVLYANPAWAKMHGYTVDEIVGKHLSIFHTQEQLEKEVIPFNEKAMASGVGTSEIGHVRKDGTTFPTLMTTAVQKDRNGAPIGLIGSIRDITESKQAEARLNESEARYQLLSEATIEGVVIHDKGILLDANQTFATLFGYSQAEVIGMSALDFLTPDSREMTAQNIRSGYEKPYDVTGLRKDGSTFPVEITGKAIPYQGRTLRVTTLRDITERKQAESAVLEEKKISDATINSMPGIFYMFDVQGNLIRWNKNYETVVGYSTEEISSRNALDAIADEDKERTGQGIQRAFTEGNATLESLLQTRQGIKIPYLFSALRMSIDNNMYVVGTGFDVSERKQLESQIRQAFERRGYQVQISTEISQELAAATELDELFRQVVTLTKERLNYYHTQLLRYDPALDAVFLIKGYGETGRKMLAGGHKMPMGSGLIGTAAASGETVMRPTLADDPDWKPNPLLPETQGEIAVPIKWQDNILGVLDVQSNEAGALTEDDRLLLESLCGQIAIAMHNAELVEAIRQSEGRLAEAAAIAKLGYWEFDALNDTYTFTDQFYALLRTTAEREGGYQMSSREYASRFMHPDDRYMVGSEIQKSIETFDADHVEQFENRFIRADGSEGYVTGRSRVVKDAQGRTVKTIGFNQDITERKQAEEALRINEARLSDALRVARLGNWEYDFENDLFIFTDDFYSIFRTTAEKVGGYKISSADYSKNFVHPDDASLVGSEIQKVLDAKDRLFTTHLEHRIIFSDGEVGYIAVNINVERDENGKITRWYGANQDITERKQSEARLAEALRAARLANWEYDVEKDLFTFNDQFYSIFHTTAEKVGGYQLSSARYAELFVHPEDVHLVGAEIGKALSSTERVYTTALDHRILYADGGVGFITVKVTVERDENGKITRFYGANQDITERKAAEEALRRSQQEMAERLDEINRLYQAMSREGWKTYRETKDLPTGFMFDRTGLQPVDDLALTDERFAHIPMKVLGGEVVGNLAVAHDPEHPISKDDLDFLQQVSDQVALALEGARLSAQTQSALAQTEKLSEAGLQFTRASDLQSLVKIAAEMLDIPSVNRAALETFTYNAEDEVIGMDVIANWWSGTGHQPTAVGTHYTTEILPLLKLFLTSGPNFIQDAFQDERIDGVSMQIIRMLNVRAVAVLPLFLADRQLGVLLLESEQPHNFTQDEVRLFTAMGPQISTVLENRRQFERAQKQAERESTLNVISQKIQSATTVEAVLQIAARELGHALGAPMTIAQLSMKDKK